MKHTILAACLLVPALAAAQQKPFSWDDVIGPAIEGGLVGYYTGETLYRSGKDAHALGYVMAVHDATWATQRKYCVPDSVKAGQLFDVAWRFLEQNPQLRHHSASYLVRQSFTTAWPCPGN